MRLRVRRNLGDQAQEFSTADVDSALNRAHRWDVPDAVGAGILTDVQGQFATGIGEVELDEQTRSVQPLLDRGGMPYLIMGPESAVPTIASSSRAVPITFDAARFWEEYRRHDDDTLGTPSGVLIEGRKILCRPFPDQDFLFWLRIEKYDDELTGSGVDYGPRALADVYGAVLELARESGYDFIVAATQPLFDAKIMQIKRARLSDAPGKDFRGYL